MDYQPEPVDQSIPTAAEPLKDPEASKQVLEDLKELSEEQLQTIGGGADLAIDIPDDDSVTDGGWSTTKKRVVGGIIGALILGGGLGGGLGAGLHHHGSGG